MTVNGRLYKTLAIIIVIGLTKSLLPQPVWDDLLSVSVVQASVDTTNIHNAVIETPLENILSPESAEQLLDLESLTINEAPNGFLINQSLLPGATESIDSTFLDNPLSISRIQSAYVYNPGHVQYINGGLQDYKQSPHLRFCLN